MFLKVQLPDKLAPVISLPKYCYMAICGQWCHSNPASLCTYLWIQPFNIKSIIQSNIISPILTFQSYFMFSLNLVTLNVCEGQIKLFFTIQVAVFFPITMCSSPPEVLYVLWKYSAKITLLYVDSPPSALSHKPI